MATGQNKTRPADDRIPAAVRDAFQSNRLQAAWRIASSATSDSRLPAIDGVCRILEKEGLNLADVMTAVLTIKGDAAPAAPTMESAFGGFGDIFSASAFARKPAQAQTAPTPPKQKIRQGGDIPSTIHGTIRIFEERDTKVGRMIVFDVTDSQNVYGPIVCFAATGIGRLKAAVDEDSFVAMSVRQPNGSGMNPTATNIRIM
jgi:hypothetical protein